MNELLNELSAPGDQDAIQPRVEMKPVFARGWRPTGRSGDNLNVVDRPDDGLVEECKKKKKKISQVAARNRWLAKSHGRPKGEIGKQDRIEKGPEQGIRNHKLDQEGGQ
jgi:hypothetical protein